MAKDQVARVPFLEAYAPLISAVITVLAAIVIARLVDRLFVVRSRRHAHATEEDPGAATRIRVVRRLVTALILVIGVSIALSQFQEIRRLATAVLASSAAIGVVVGFAARQTIANAVAGVSLAVNQPIRIGDLVTFEEETGVVEDIRLTYTYIRDDEGHRIIVPNERLAQTTIENHTIVDPRVNVTASVWLPPGADASRALDVLSGEDQVDVTVGEVTKDGIRIDLSTWVATAAERGPTAARLRAGSLAVLHDEGLSLPDARG